MPDLNPIIGTLRARIPIAGLVAETVELAPAGNLLRGRCSAHRDDAEGLYVHPAQDFYNCFSCGCHGDVVRWMGETARCSEEDAIALLCGRAGLDPHPPGHPSAEG